MSTRNYLKHYGIAGMKWGRRKSHTTVSIVKPSSEDHNKRVELTKKKLHEMTNDELRMYTQRMNLEKQYKELSKAEISFGKKLVNEVVNSATTGVKTAALSYVNKQSAKMVEELLKKTVKAAT